MLFGKRKVKFNKVLKFNYELDTNQKLKAELKNLALCKNDMNKLEYLSRMLYLFSQEVELILAKVTQKDIYQELTLILTVESMPASSHVFRIWIRDRPIVILVKET